MEWLSCDSEPLPAPNPQATTLFLMPVRRKPHYFYDSMISFCTGLKVGPRLRRSITIVNVARNIKAQRRCAG